MTRSVSRGISLAELLITIAVIGVIVSAAAGQFTTYRRHAAVRVASMELRSIFHLARSRAIARSTNTGVRFARAGDDWTYTLYDDGDGDGVRNDDIRRGRDRMVMPPRMVLTQTRIARIALPPFPITDPDGDRLEPARSPVHFNRSSICAFAPLGQATPGTIYLTDGAGEIYAVRVFGTTARTRLLRYNQDTRRWVER